MTAASRLPQLTDKQSRALKFIVEFSKHNGVPPTWTEVARHLASKSKNPDMLHRLLKHGYLERLPVATRNIRPTDQAQAWYTENFGGQGLLL
jgi:SOS-response transcriptional repressor LexA